jgi:hypothetical protein
MTINPKTVQAFIAYLSIVAGVLTTTLQGVHLPPIASAILGIFGVLLHPQTSITVPTTTVKVTSAEPPA